MFILGKRKRYDVRLTNILREVVDILVRENVTLITAMSADEKKKFLVRNLRCIAGAQYVHMHPRYVEAAYDYMIRPMIGFFELDHTDSEDEEGVEAAVLPPVAMSDVPPKGVHRPIAVKLYHK